MVSLLQHEVAALRRIASKDNAGIAEAFGAAFPHNLKALVAQGYHYTIRLQGTGLELEIDAYGAWNAPASGLEFDVDACEEQMIIFESSEASRRSYRELRLIARSVLAGAAIRLADGQVRNFKKEARACAAIL